MCTCNVDGINMCCWTHGVDISMDEYLEGTCRFGEEEETFDDDDDGDYPMTCADLLHPMEALCQDCLRVIPLDQLVPDANDPPGRCPHCGGSTCTCEACVYNMVDLRAGRFDRIAMKPWLKVVAWSEHDGATTAHVLLPLARAKGYGKATWRVGYEAGNLGVTYRTYRAKKAAWRGCSSPRYRFSRRDYWYMRFIPMPF
jgi:hypothetical protein